MMDEKIRGLEERLQNEINKTNEQVNFLKDVIRKYSVTQLDDSMFKDWKNKQGIFRS